MAPAFARARLWRHALHRPLRSAAEFSSPCEERLKRSRLDGMRATRGAGVLRACVLLPCGRRCPETDERPHPARIRPELCRRAPPSPQAGEDCRGSVAQRRRLWTDRPIGRVTPTLPAAREVASIGAMSRCPVRDHPPRPRYQCMPFRIRDAAPSSRPEPRIARPSLLRPRSTVTRRELPGLALGFHLRSSDWVSSCRFHVGELGDGQAHLPASRMPVRRDTC